MILKCSETEKIEKNEPRSMAQRLRELSWKKVPSNSTVIKDRHGNILTDRDEVLQRWKECVEELYDDRRQQKPNYNLEEQSLPNLKEEVVKAVKIIQWQKSEGSDGFEIEVVEAAGEFGI